MIRITRDNPIFYDHTSIPSLGAFSFNGFWTKKRLNESKANIIADLTAIGLDVSQQANEIIARKSAKRQYPYVELTFNKAGTLVDVYPESDSYKEPD